MKGQTMNPRDLKEIAEAAIKIARMLSHLPPQRQMEIMLVAQMFVNIEAQRAAVLQAQPRPPQPEDEEM